MMTITQQHKRLQATNRKMEQTHTARARRSERERDGENETEIELQKDNERKSNNEDAQKATNADDLTFNLCEEYKR